MSDKPRDETSAVRLDRWLWAARFYKTRSQAAEGIDGGKVQLNGARVKRSRLVHVGDTVRLRKPPYEWILVVKSLSEHRGGASEAQLLYQETVESASARERIHLGLRAQASVAYDGRGRPTKRERREIDRMKDRQD